MAEESPPAAPAPESPPEPKPAATPKKSGARKDSAAAKPSTDAAPAKKAEKKGPKAPRRPTLDAASTKLLRLRDAQDDRRPRFTRQASYRYWRIGRDGAWRRPRGLQSKQRRHYGYRSVVVRIGYRGPRLVRGLTPSGFAPVLIHTPRDLEKLDPAREAALIAHGVGTKKRLVLEEAARKRGVHLLNPLVSERGEA
ncbi:MAG: 50S ribosomal protein L32e [Thermoplasmata archaeon]|nr:50S ribosomal protein L32e [Thermoplasmata archaeon]